MADYRVTVILENGEEETILVSAYCEEEAEIIAENKIRGMKHIYLIEKIDEN